MSSSSLQRYRTDINLLSPNRVPSSNNNKRNQNDSNRKHDLERPQMTSKDIKRTQLTSSDLTEHETNTESTVKRISNKKNEHSSEGGSVYKNIENNDKN